MSERTRFKTISGLVILIAAVIALSAFSNRIWGGKPEKPPESKTLAVTPDMTVAEFGQANDLPNPMLKKIFDLKQRPDLQRPLSQYGSADEVRSLVRRRLALAAEHASKNWIKILVKFVLWFAVLTGIFRLFGKQKVRPALRKEVLLFSLVLFGVILGADPSPMGTVKDAIHLLGSAGAVFPPRMIALTVFLLLVFLANKYICAWGCQIGTLQDLVFQLNRTDAGQAVIGRQIKLPFGLTNTVRVSFLAVFTLAAFAWGTDIVEPIDPFKIYKPLHLGWIGGGFAGLLLLAGLFVYRPWCHLFCPFGLAGWLVEKISRVNVSVDYQTCIACEKCARACPTTVMAAILHRDKQTIPDCFACYTCRDVCPTGSVSFSSRKRDLPPPGHFEGTNKANE